MQASPAPSAQPAPASAVPVPAMSQPDTSRAKFRVEFASPDKGAANTAILQNLRTAMNVHGALEEVSSSVSEGSGAAKFVLRFVTGSPEEDIWEAFAFVVDPANLSIESKAVANGPEPVHTSPASAA